MDKFILADVTEGRYLPAPVQELCTFIAGVEELTGADFIITPLDIPFKSEALIRRHATMGLCVQRKDIGDLAQSLREEDGRLYNQLLRMRGVCPTPTLLVIGDLKCSKEGKAILDGRESEWNYFALNGAMRWWQWRGGFIEWISRDTLLAEWCHILHNTLLEREKRGGEWMEHGVSRPIPQLLYAVPDVQRTLLTFPGVGSVLSEAIHKRAVAMGADHPTLTDCLIVIQDTDVLTPKTRKRCLKHAGWYAEE